MESQLSVPRDVQRSRRRKSHSRIGFTAMTSSVKWPAQLHGVREVSLRGTADLGFWHERLADEQLTPEPCEGRASISIIGAAGKFAGVRFRELSVSVGVTSAADSAGLPSYFLDRAFNSNRFFAFCERVFFSTPYDYANVNVESPDPTEISVTRNGHTLIGASILHTAGSTSREPAQEREESWMARIMLPSSGRTAGRQKKMFFARISGATAVIPFNSGEDSIALHAQANGDVFDALLKSNFVPVEWIVRSNATHAKSKTYNRDWRGAVK